MNYKDLYNKWKRKMISLEYSHSSEISEINFKNWVYNAIDDMW